MYLWWVLRKIRHQVCNQLQIVCYLYHICSTFFYRLTLLHWFGKMICFSINWWSFFRRGVPIMYCGDAILRMICHVGHIGRFNIYVAHVHNANEIYAFNLWLRRRIERWHHSNPVIIAVRCKQILLLLYIVNILKTVAVEVYFGIEQRICLNTLTELTVTLFAQRVFAFLKQFASQN